MVEFIDERINHLAWQEADEPISVITGSKSRISIWQLIDSPESYDQLPITQVASVNSLGEVNKVLLIDNIAYSSTINGTVALHGFNEGPQPSESLKQISVTSKLHPGYKCNDMIYCAATKSVITCGNDGKVSKFEVEHPKKVENMLMSNSSLKCMDLVKPSEIICGTLSGLKHFDLRSKSCVGNFSNRGLATLTCIRRNPFVNHLAIGGTDQGSIILYDLRSPDTALAQITAHGAAITALKYRPRDPSILYSSSCDGELFRWELSSEIVVNHMPRKVESIVGTMDPLSISSFDLNERDDLIYTTDHGAIFYKRLVL